MSQVISDKKTVLDLASRAVLLPCANTDLRIANMHTAQFTCSLHVYQYAVVVGDITLVLGQAQ